MVCLIAMIDRAMTGSGKLLGRRGCCSRRVFEAFPSSAFSTDTSNTLRVVSRTPLFSLYHPFADQCWTRQGHLSDLLALPRGMAADKARDP